MAVQKLHESLLLFSDRVREIRRTRQTYPANFGNVRRRAVVKFNQMSGEKLEMSGKAQNNFAYSDFLSFLCQR